MSKNNMDKKYLPISIKKQKRVNSVKGVHVPAILTEEEWTAIEQKADAYTLAAKLAEMRTKSGITQKEMAKALAVSQPRISEIESTPNSAVSLANIRRYVEITQQAFKANLENGIVISLSRPKTATRTATAKP